MKHKLIHITLSILLLFMSTTGITMAASTYKDVPEGHWSERLVYAAQQHGLMQGTGNGVFGFGSTITKAEFSTVLTNMFKWDQVRTDVSSFSDVSLNQWYFPFVETALYHGVMDMTQTFNPDEPILREEMAAMLVRALGYQSIAKKAEGLSTHFTDVTDYKGYITVAYDIGMIKGTSDTTFDPKKTATREEAATMLVQVYEKYIAKTEWLHGFYAFSSFEQRYVTTEMDAVSAGWSRMSFDAVNGAFLNTTSASGNEWRIPSLYESITSYLEIGKTPLNLSIYMDTGTTVTLPDGSKTSTVKAILLNDSYRVQAVDAIVTELTRTYPAIGKNPYSGVTIDFEGLKGNDTKAGFNAFLTELSSALKPLGKSLYVTVQPVMTTGSYYDGFDYKTIGQLADKVILMAHDYNVLSLKGYEGTTWFKNTALTPIDQVYFALKAIADPATGVEDQDKIALAISFSSIGWKISDGKLISGTPVKPSPVNIYNRLMAENTVMGYSQDYKNPNITYTTETGDQIFLWYEDSRSISDKIQLARLFGIKGVSIWRIGTIPDYPDAGIYYNVMNSVK